ncbi:hypothetical protein PUNSTDRAFT_46138 [Punctularia strigosozonata HHB-11173 SS5]|uniref:uncharacterized protein n=1 Tax=Punctularia strigosozonata (strain HHB-11173) TaxID=741275 RepID=UPI0004417EB1|nr:uncharacterized protein PUNSTDRAFT_46138 [Punctularia strigosozonata HHB-11173 SS5]EIN06731.1 hypothetical protein PUNSTDRAFT_46138 [Punctularia strigosozonata HHB-11173 SS5]
MVAHTAPLVQTSATYLTSSSRSNKPMPKSTRRRRSRPSRHGSAPSKPKNNHSSSQGHNRTKKLAIIKSRHRQHIMANLAASKARRARWAEIALGTQRIVMGDGKYVEERTCVPSSLPSPLLTEPFSEGSVALPVVHDIGLQIQFSRQGTQFYPHYSEHLAKWYIAPQVKDSQTSPTTTIEFTSMSPLSTARSITRTSAVGVLSFASAKRPGGGYLNGGDEQEERLARSTALVASLTAPAGLNFYEELRRFASEDGSGLQAHSVLYSPGVSVIRSDDERDDGKFIEPYAVDIVSAVPVNAAAVRRRYHVTESDSQMFEDGIRTATKERLARVLRVFEDHGDRQLVLGAFGCGSNENNVEMIAEIWAELLVTGPSSPEEGKARFANVFESIVFAIPPRLIERFKTAFDMRVFEAEVEKAASDEDD